MRFDPYSRVHKGLRTLLFDTAALVARTDFSGGETHFGASDPVGCTLDAVRVLLGFLREHGEHEDRVVMPELRRLGPEVCSRLAEEHAALEELHHLIEVLVARIDAGGAERAALGRELDAALTRLVVRHLEHMEREEAEGNSVLWAALDDGELEVLLGRILATIGPERMQQWRTLIAPTLAARERQALAR
ncbi:hemerythrin domain-containing protein [Vulgatibacter sp.]|uniref:hemerythrin domain-containing protein n=1 Tax=Vulgatibacter sp. TaxID=1971226 RepID=UPI003561738A